MKVSLNWLKEFVDVDISPDRLSDLLINAGLEVEAVSRPGEGFDDVVVARILTMRPHPNADRLTLCSVSTGEKTHSIVCGAKNMKEGDIVALSVPGAHLPNGMKISKSKIRGEVSEGMLCSETELGLAKESAGIMILPAEMTPGEPFAKAMMLDDTIFDINITPNRADCLSVLGIAREVAALTDRGLKRKETKIAGKKLDPSMSVSVDVLDGKACPRYGARVIKGVKIGQSPLWLKRRLEAAGVRPINNVVDVTNYVMLETGQPLHAFDFDLLNGKKIEVRRAVKDEKMTTLDGVERVLSLADLVIADGRGPVALAGVMGGMGSEVSDGTVNILLESAFFDPSTVRKAAKRHSLHSESSHRFERGVDPNGVPEASGRAAGLIIDLAGGEVSSEVIDIYREKREAVDIEFRLNRAKEIIGISLNLNTVIDIFRRLGFTVKETGGERLRVTPPTYRFDLSREIDLVEEIARFTGYDNIPVTHPVLEAGPGEKDRSGICRETVRRYLTSTGFYEAVTYGFLSRKSLSAFLPSGKEPICLLNPLSEEQSVMRTTIIPLLLDVAGRNLSHQNNDLRFFEIGRVFPFNEPDGEEHIVVSGVMTGMRYKKSWNVPAEELDFFDLKGVTEGLLGASGLTAVYIADENIGYLHPGKSARIEVGGIEIGLMGELHPDVMDAFDIKQRVYVFELDLSEIMVLGHPASYVSIPRFPAVYRDMAIMVDNDVHADMIQKTIKGVDPLIDDVTLFDIYTGRPVPEGKKSVAFSIRYQAQDRTLKDEEINTAQDKVLTMLKDAVGGELRQ